MPCTVQNINVKPLYVNKITDHPIFLTLKCDLKLLDNMAFISVNEVAHRCANITSFIQGIFLYDDVLHCFKVLSNC